jgi:hypothetical protein
MIVLSDNTKVNLGLGIKFEAKGTKAPGYSRKDGRFWEFSERAIGILNEYKVIASYCHQAFLTLAIGKGGIPSHLSSAQSA